MARADAKYSVTLEDKTQQALRRIQRNLGRVDGAIVSMSRGLGGLAGIVGVGAIVALGKQSIDAADRIGKLSDRLGASTEALSEYQHVADLSGVSFDTLTLGWQRMTRRIAEAADGTGEARGALEELNLNAKALNTLAPEQQFEVIADAIQGVTNQSDRVRLAMKLFDSEGVSLIQTMGAGAVGIREMRAEARELGKSLGRDQTDAAARANDALTRLNAVFSGLSTTFTTNLAGPIADVVEYFNKKIPTAVNYTKASYASLAYVVTTLRQGLNIISFDFDEAEALGKQADGLMEMYRSSLAAAEGTSKLEDAQERLSRRVAEITSDIENAKGRIESYGDVRPGDQFYNVVRRDQMLIEAYQQDLSNVRAELERTKSALAAAGSNTMLTGDDSGPSIETVQNRRVEAMRAAVVQMADLDMEWSSIARQQSQIRIDTVRREESEKAEARERGIALLGDMGILMNSESRKMFELGKAASTAHAIISGIEAVQDAYKWGQKWGGPPLGAAFASAAALVTAARVQQIRSVQFTGGGSAANSAVGNAVPGGAGPGGAAGTLTPIGQSEPQTQRVTNVYISGYIDTAEGRRVLGDIFRDLDRDDVVFLSANGANAQAIRSGV